MQRVQIIEGCETWFNWPGSDFSLRFTHLSLLPLISPAHDPFIYIHLLQKCPRISTICNTRPIIGEEGSNKHCPMKGRKSSFVWVRAAATRRHWFAADRDPPADRLISTLHFSTLWTQFIAFYIYLASPYHCYTVVLTFLWWHRTTEPQKTCTTNAQLDFCPRTYFSATASPRNEPRQVTIGDIGDRWP